MWTIVVAAGRGERFGADKQFEEVGKVPAAQRAVEAARAVSDGVVIVLPPATRWSGSSVEAAVPGGPTRARSVRAGLAVVPDAADVVVVHDAARPLAPVALFESVVAAVEGGADGAVPALAVPDTIKRVDAEGAIVETLDRASLVAVQTPQAFRAGVLRSAHAHDGEATDDAALVEAHGGRVVTVPGDPRNRKLTTRDDLVALQAMARDESA